MTDPADLDFCYLATTGRNTGNRHEIEIWFALEDRTAYLLSGGGVRSDWVRNIVASPTVVLRIGDVERTTHARVVEPGTAEDAMARQLLVDKYGSGDRSDLTEWGRTSLPVAIDWPEHGPDGAEGP